MQVEGTMDMATINHQVWINAPVPAVYEALSTAEGISRWWDKQTSRLTDGALILEHSPGPEHGVVQLKVLEMTPDRRVEWECISNHPRTSPASGWTGTHLVFELRERKDFPPALASWATAIPAQTILDFRHSGWDDRNDYLGFCSFAWAEVLLRLKTMCEAGG
jgi:uncharacterized protein YndB with AHSA1/START domain